MACQPWLLKTTATTGMSYCTAVASSWIVMRKSPSPTRATTGTSGRASLAPSAAG